ncbi:MAG: RsmG family class I SAM-dependent methyltransferase, partial [Fimbriimonadaceae bacterium]
IFLQNVSRETLTPVTIHTTRIETLSKITFDLVVARALAPLSDLISHAFPLLQQEESGKNLGVCHFLKGQNYRTEIEEAQKHWEFDHHITPSMSSQNGVIITITNVRHA